MKLILLSLLLFSTFTINAVACSDADLGMAPLCAYFTRADVVFVGKMLKNEKAPKGESFSDGSLIRFEVLQKFKGADNPNLSVFTPRDCYMNFKKGEIRLIFAKYDIVNKTFTVFHREIVATVENDTNVKMIQDLLAGKTDTAISGKLASFGNDGEYLYEPVEIIVEGKDKKFTAKTDENGEYNIPVPSDGTYKVEMKFPYEALLKWNENLLGTSFIKGVPSIFKYEARLNDGDCLFSLLIVYKSKK